jgi:hypothetical protein
MADDGFLEPIEADAPSTDAAGAQPAPGQAAADSAPQGDSGAETPPEGTASNDPAEEASRQADEALRKAQEDAAYWRGVAEAARGGNGGAAQQPQTLSEEEIKRQEEEFLADPHGYVNRMVEEKLNTGLGQYRLNQSVAAMQREAPDFDVMAVKFRELANKNPSLWSQADADVDPARWAYNYAKQQDELSKHGGDPSKLKESLKKELLPELEAEIRQKIALEQAGETPPTPATAGGSGGTAPAKPTETNLDPLAGNPYD